MPCIEVWGWTKEKMINKDRITPAAGASSIPELRRYWRRPLFKLNATGYYTVCPVDIVVSDEMSTIEKHV